MTFLVTGALGCIGAWVVRELLQEGVPVVGYDLGESTHRLDQLVSPDRREGLTLIRGDITQAEPLEATLDELRITHVIHLAALQVPFCRADPQAGAMVNVVGTVNVFEAVRGRNDRIRGVTYASSFAVYGPNDVPGGAGCHHPETLYGAFKEANEATARVYWEEHGVASAALRPYVVYGVGRDQGLTSSPTQAMAAAARGEGFTIGFGGRSQFHYAPDVARAFIELARNVSSGADVHDLPGATVAMPEVISAIEQAAPDVEGRIEFEDVPLPFPAESTVVIDLPHTQLEIGVRETVERFRALAP